jgi:membrane-associated phospholipid phosphatase
VPRFSIGIPLVALLLCSGAEARAADGSVRQLRYDTRVDIAVTSVGSVWWVSSELLKTDLVPEKCRWCYRAEDGSDRLNHVDGLIRRSLVWKDTRRADITSSVVDFVALPMVMMSLSAVAAANDKATHGFPLDALLITEATVLAADVNQLVKYAFARERPFVHFLPRVPDAVRAATDSPSDDNLSFFSGHTTLAFALATSAGTVTTLRGYRLAPVVWATGLSMATTVGYLRIAADKHYFSDVVTGMIVGSIIGAGVPLLFHSASSTSNSPPSASGQALSGPVVRSAFSIGSPF